MKYRIMKKHGFDGTMFSIEKHSGGDTIWLHVTDSCSGSLEEVNAKMDFITQHGEPRHEVIREVTVDDVQSGALLS